MSSTRRATDTHESPLHAKRRLAVLGVGFGAYLLSAALSRAPAFTETIYANGVSRILSRPLSLVTGLFPFSVAEFLVVAYVGIWLWRASRGVARVRKGPEPLGRVLAAGGLMVARDVGAILTAFYVLWGFNYARARLEDRLGWQVVGEVELEELVGIASGLISAANESYREMHGVDDSGFPTSRPVAGRIDDDLHEGWRRTVNHLDLPGWMASSYGGVKTVIASPFLARVGVTGFYFPYTAEANVRRGLPGITVARTMAHEQAHQRGVSVESEATFLGYLVCVLSPSVDARYSGITYALLRMANDIFAQSPERWDELYEDVIPGVKRDLRQERDYFRQFQGVGTTVGSAVNDRYLRANRVRGGVRNYGHSTLLFVAYARRRGGSILPSATEAGGNP